MSRFAVFYDYANNLIIDEEYPEYISILPEVGDYVSWIEENTRHIAKVVDIDDEDDEDIIVTMGRSSHANNIDMTKAIPLSKNGLEQYYIIKKD